MIGETKLICWSRGLSDPILSKTTTKILQNFGQLAFFLIYFFCFLKKNKKQEEEIKHNKLM